MKTKSLKKLARMLNRNDGVSLIAIIALLVIMSVMGGVFSSVMGRWKISAPTTINSSKALYLAETAAMFALQDAKYRFFSKDATGTPLFPSSTSLAIGTRSSPFQVVNTATESADFWIERPNSSGNPTVDIYPPGHPQAGSERGDDDDDNSSSNDDVYDDDLDDSIANNTLYTIIATGKILRNGTTVAKRQIKIKATITDSSGDPVDPGIHTTGDIFGSGPGFDIENPDTGDTVTYGNGPAFDIDAGDETDLVYHPSSPPLDEDVFRALAQDQGHYYSGNFPSNPPTDPYPDSSFFFDTPTGTIPNVIFIEGDFAINGNDVFYGIYYVKGSTTTLNGSYQLNGILISEGDISMNGSPIDPDINGGIIHTGGSITANGNPNISINEGFFDALDASIPIITVQSSQEAVSAN